MALTRLETVVATSDDCKRVLGEVPKKDSYAYSTIKDLIHWQYDGTKTGKYRKFPGGPYSSRYLSGTGYWPDALLVGQDLVLINTRDERGFAQRPIYWNVRTNEVTAIGSASTPANVACSSRNGSVLYLRAQTMGPTGYKIRPMRAVKTEDGYAVSFLANFNRDAEPRCCSADGSILYGTYASQYDPLGTFVVKEGVRTYAPVRFGSGVHGYAILSACTRDGTIAYGDYEGGSKHGTLSMTDDAVTKRFGGKRVEINGVSENGVAYGADVKAQRPARFTRAGNAIRIPMLAGHDRGVAVDADLNGKRIYGSSTKTGSGQGDEIFCWSASIGSVPLAKRVGAVRVSTLFEASDDGAAFIVSAFMPKTAAFEFYYLRAKSAKTTEEPRSSGAVANGFADVALRRSSMMPQNDPPDAYGAYAQRYAAAAAEYALHAGEALVWDSAENETRTNELDGYAEMRRLQATYSYYASLCALCDYVRTSDASAYDVYRTSYLAAFCAFDDLSNP